MVLLLPLLLPRLLLGLLALLALATCSFIAAFGWCVVGFRAPQRCPTFSEGSRNPVVVSGARHRGQSHSRCPLRSLVPSPRYQPSLLGLIGFRPETGPRVRLVDNPHVLAPLHVAGGSAQALEP